MVEVIERQDAERADRLAQEHLALFRDRVIRHLMKSLASEIPIKDPASLELVDR
jgi:hypothetical protein